MEPKQELFHRKLLGNGVRAAPVGLKIVGDYLGLGGFDEDGWIRLLHADEPDGHGLKARLVQNVGVNARLQGVFLEQLFRRLVRRAARLVVDDQCA